ncbi:QsdR family transcriptional regulator [Actinomadura roseirufa]|uniref:QsdR family transcriptional regulator n=1 Tax=Actinomadura roseirufa TaxID=2094049 RepID=UPI001041350A|nr:QsdR family transcriptional regulator [Actinomadura roseirufa]
MEQTPLQRQLAGRTRKPTALDAFKRARADFLAGRRIDLRSLAAELGVSRVTLYRWVGTREQLLVEVIWSLTEQTFQDEWQRLSAEPGPRVPKLMVRLLKAIWDQPGARRFLEQENDLAMRLLTLSAHGFQPRLLDLVREKVADDIREGRVESPIPLDDLAYTVLRVTESFHYLPTITGEPADPDRAGRVLGALLMKPGPGGLA